jgi:Domain of unknown function (DUF4386)
MKNQRSIGILLILGASGVLIPYTALTIIFEYPDILRQDTGAILTKFHEGGSQLILTWWAFAILGMPLIVAYIQMGELLSSKIRYLKWLTTIGVIGLVAQMLGLLRWVFVVPVLANHFVTGSETTKEASIIAFQLVHQYGGVLLGEHIGQLFTIIWSIGISYALSASKTLPSWIAWLGYISSAIYLVAQTELFATVIPGLIVVGWAGFAGSTLWIMWLIALGIGIIRIK